MNLEAPVRYWACPSCGTRDMTQEAQPHTRMHHCGKLGLVAPMVEVPRPDDKVDAKHEVHMRDDYTGQNDPVQSVRTHHADGRQDVNVFPMAAQGIGEVK